MKVLVIALEYTNKESIIEAFTLLVNEDSFERTVTLGVSGHTETGVRFDMELHELDGAYLASYHNLLQRGKQCI